MKGRVLLLSVLVWHLGVQSGTATPDGFREASAITCPQACSISLRSTDRLPEASGAVRVERKGGTTEVDVEVDSMKPASLFGGDYNTYMVWVVPPGGPADNLGELNLEGDHATLHGTTPASSFAVLVTAEPHFLVTTPSTFLILANQSRQRAPEFQYPVLQGVYNFERSTLEDSREAKGRVHTELRQAFTAVRLAQRANAPSLASNEFTNAERALDQTLRLWHQSGDPSEIAAQARQTVRLAVAAQRLAMDRRLQGSRVGAEGSGGGNNEIRSLDPRGR
jgi:hypothetical protein